MAVYTKLRKKIFQQFENHNRLLFDNTSIMTKSYQFVNELIDNSIRVEITKNTAQDELDELSQAGEPIVGRIEVINKTSNIKQIIKTNYSNVKRVIIRKISIDADIMVDNKDMSIFAIFMAVQETKMKDTIKCPYCSQVLQEREHIQVEENTDNINIPTWMDFEPYRSQFIAIMTKINNRNK